MAMFEDVAAGSVDSGRPSSWPAPTAPSRLQMAHHGDYPPHDIPTM